MPSPALAVLLPLVLATSPVDASEPTLAERAGPLLSSEAELGLSVAGEALERGDTRSGDIYAGPLLRGRLAHRGVLLEGAALFLLPRSSRGAAAGGNGFARIGFSGHRWALLGGVALQYAPAAQPTLQLLPSLQGRAAFRTFQLSAGLFDPLTLGLAPAHLLLELDDFGLGYVAPLGALATLRARVGTTLSLRLAALAFRLGRAEVGLFTASIAVGPEGERP